MRALHRRGFAPAGQRVRIAGVFPEGRVGAEVMLDGVCWSVVRPIGAGRRHLAIRDAELSQVTLQDDAASGLAPFLDAVVAAFLPDEVATLVPGGNATNAWLTALAWLSRDIHDSPREADLGPSVHHRLFDLARHLEAMDAQPLFQYIVTTTTSPPDELRPEPWLAVILGGDGEARLMKRDL